MKTKLCHRGLAAVFVTVLSLIGTVSWSAAAEEAATGSLIQVHVTIPPTPAPTAEHNVGERFVDLMAEVFRLEDFTGRIERIDDLDEPKPDAIVLRINLTEWDPDHAGNINCRFSAVLQAAGTEKNLDSFYGTAPRILTGPGRFGVSRAFDDAAEDALRDLHDALAKTDLIVGLRSP